MAAPTLPESTLAPGDARHGFVADRVEPLDDLRARAYLLEHQSSGARVLHVHADDAENLFSVSFATPPPDDTGLPHIMEHSVLAGSRKYRVRDPFFEMVKTSMATFINAMTGGDRTYYPVSSNVERDLFNLASVYLDAVFDPILAEQTFRREGHHLAPASGDADAPPLTVSGIVYNEMKGAYSAPTAQLGRALRKGLLPDTIYARDSGGDPEKIPDLTYDAFLEFHRDCYRPDNALIFLYGDIATDRYLELLAPALSRFERGPERPPIARQPRFDAPRDVEGSYPVTPRDPTAERTFLALQWLTGDADDPVDSLLMGALSNLLLGSAAAPLRKAITDAQLGADLILAGSGSVGREAIFSLALKDSEPERMAAFRELVESTLHRIADAPIDPEDVASAFRKLAFRQLEIQGAYPLRLMYGALSNWAYGGDPLESLAMPRHLTTCRERYAGEPDLFNRLIRERLLDNAHRLAVTLRPDGRAHAQQAEALRDRMRSTCSAMTAEQLAEAVAAAKALDQRDADAERAAAAALPRLSTDDLPTAPAEVPTSAVDLGDGTTLLYNDVFSNGVSYLELAFDVSGLPAELWPYLPHYQAAIRSMGTADEDYAATARRVAAATGQLSCHSELSTHGVDPARPVWRVQIGFSALDDQLEAALDAVERLLFTVDPRDSARLSVLLRRGLARRRTGLTQDGHSTSTRHAAAGLSLEGHLKNELAGLPQLQLTESLVAHPRDHEQLMAQVERIRDFVCSPGRLTASFTGDAAAAETCASTLRRWLGRMQPLGSDAGGVDFTPAGAPTRTGLAGPTTVAYCAKVLPAPHLSSPDTPLLSLATHLCRIDYMMDRIRLQGNAYGASVAHDPLAQTLTLASWRDPHVKRTLEVFEGLIDYVRQLSWSRQELDQAIFATAKNHLRPIRPARATTDALRRHLTGQTPELRRERYRRLCTARPEEARRALLEALEEGMPQGAVAVVASREKLEADNPDLPGGPLEIIDVGGQKPRNSTD